MEHGDGVGLKKAEYGDEGGSLEYEEGGSLG